MAIQLEQLRSMVSDGKIFGVKFVKRTDGAIRVMSCRTGVVPPPNTTGHQRNWDPTERNLLQVFDLHKKGYRMIPAESVLELSVRGQRIAL